MATTFSVPRVMRTLTTDMFTDLGFPTIAFTFLEPSGCQIDLTENLTAAQIQRAKIRIMTKDSVAEGLMLAIPNAVADVNTYLAIASPSNAQALAQVKLLAQDVKGILSWIGRDVLT